jgi:hypothetical protein
MPSEDPLHRTLEERLSVARLRPYRQAGGGDLEPALALYAWNTLAAGAFFEDLGHLEVVLRNALHTELAAWHANNRRPGEWYDDPAGLLAPQRLDDVAAARQRLSRSRQVETSGKIVAELTFGFWRFLLDKRYQTTLWAPALRHAFPHLTPRNRALVYEPLDRLHRLRNRIAHQEPIHHFPLPDHHADLLRLVGFIDPTVQTWITSGSRVPQILAARP